jgi:hypothetical protein
MYKDNESIFFFLNFGKKKREVQKTCGAIKSGINILEKERTHIKHPKLSSKCFILAIK